MSFKLRPITKYILFIAGVYLGIVVLFPGPGLQEDNPAQDISVIKLPEQPTKILEIVSVDPAFTSAEKDIIREATTDWSYYTDDLATFQFAENLTEINPEEGQRVVSLLIIPVNSSNDEIVSADKLSGNTTLGLFDDSPFIPTILIVEDRVQDRNEYFAVVMHELGHSLGLNHTKHRDTLMYPYVGI